MSEFNANRMIAAMKEETTAGTAIALTSGDYNVVEIDVEEPQYQSDHSPVGRAGNGSLINSAKSYSRTRGGTNPVKIELKGSATPTVKPNYFKYLEVAGFKTGVIDAGTNDNYEFYYDGKPNCKTATREVRTPSCDGTWYSKKLKGAIITGGKISMDGAGAPLMFSGTWSGAFPTPATDSTTIAVTDDAGDCVQPIGAVVLIDGDAYNITKFEYNTNSTGVAVNDTSDDTQISHFRFGEGSPTMTFSAIPAGSAVTAQYVDLFGSAVTGDFTFETADALITVSDVQFTDVQDTNEGGLLIQDKTVKCGEIRFQLK